MHQTPVEVDVDRGTRPDLECFWINGGEGKVDVRVNTYRYLFRVDGVVRPCRCPSLVVADYSADPVVLGTGWSWDLLVATKLLGGLTWVLVDRQSQPKANGKSRNSHHKTHTSSSIYLVDTRPPWTIPFRGLDYIRICDYSWPHIPVACRLWFQVMH